MLRDGLNSARQVGDEQAVRTLVAAAREAGVALDPAALGELRRVVDAGLLGMAEAATLLPARR